MGSPPSDSARSIQCAPPRHTHLPLVMDSRLVILGAALVIAATLLTGSEGISCNVCNSYEQTKCGDPFIEGLQEFQEECPRDNNTYFCRKIYQNVRGKERVVRGCGWLTKAGSDKEYYTTVSEEYNTEVWMCKEDNCNSASMFSISSVAVFSTLLMAYLLQ